MSLTPEENQAQPTRDNNQTNIEQAAQKALKLKVAEHLEHFQNIACIAGTFFANQPHALEGYQRDWPQSISALMEEVAKSDWDDSLYRADRERIERNLTPHKEEILRLLNSAVHDDVRATIMPYGALRPYRGLRGRSVFTVPDHLKAEMIDIQESRRGARTAQARSALSRLESEFKDYHRAVSQIAPEIADKISKFFGEFAKIEKALPGKTWLSVLADSNLSNASDSEREASDQKESDAVQEKLVKELVQQMVESIQTTRSNFAGINQYASMEEAVVTKHIDTILARASADIQTKGIVHVQGPNALDSSELTYLYRCLQRSSNQSEDSKASNPNQHEFSFDDTVEVQLNAVFNRIVDSLQAIGELRAHKEMGRALSKKLRDWIPEASAPQHVEFLLSKAFTDPEFFKEFPKVVGRQLVRVDRSSLPQN
ncbi:MAG: hypothetical protein KDD62_12375, partial [Bdellovibrionales bacterium]|nr:hypothetical protein [Bdellovibrionales bacterium]